MSEKSMNPIAIRSRKWIVEALMALMIEKPYSDITISEIAERSGLVRRTFYRNFNSKEEILETYFNDLIKIYLEELPEIDEVSPYTLALTYFNFWGKRIDFIQQLQRNHLFHILLHQFDAFVPELNKKFKKAIISNYSDTYFEYYSVFISAGLWHMLEHWAAKGMVETSEELAQIYSNLIL